jgi:hypothetical protein
MSLNLLTYPSFRIVQDVHSNYCFQTLTSQEELRVIVSKASLLRVSAVYRNPLRMKLILYQYRELFAGPEPKRYKPRILDLSKKKLNGRFKKSSVASLRIYRSASSSQRWHHLQPSRHQPRA